MTGWLLAAAAKPSIARVPASLTTPPTAPPTRIAGTEVASSGEKKRARAEFATPKKSPVESAVRDTDAQPSCLESNAPSASEKFTHRGDKQQSTETCAHCVCKRDAKSVCVDA